MRTIILLLFPLGLFGQITNGSFESVSPCPSFWWDYSGLSSWNQVNTPDIFTSCASTVPINIYGTSTTHSGDNYAGFLGYTPDSTQREYLWQSVFLPPGYYRVSMWFRLSPKAKYNMSVGYRLLNSPDPMSVGMGNQITLPVPPMGGWAELTDTIATPLSYSIFMIGAWLMDTVAFNALGFDYHYAYVDDVSIESISPLEFILEEPATECECTTTPFYGPVKLEKCGNKVRKVIRE